MMMATAGRAVMVTMAVGPTAARIATVVQLALPAGPEMALGAAAVVRRM